MEELATAETMMVELPAHATMIRVVRTMANQAADAAGLGYDRVEDLGLAIDESATVLLAVPAGESLTTRITGRTNSVDFVMSIDAASDRWPPDNWRDSISGMVLESVASDHAFESDQASSSIGMSVAT